VSKHYLTAKGGAEGGLWVGGDAGRVDCVAAGQIYGAVGASCCRGGRDTLEWFRLGCRLNFVAIIPERRGCPPESGEYPTAEQKYRFATL
jgi:hypothetical protein